MNFIKNNQANIFSVLSVFWSSNTVPFLRSCDNNVGFIESLNIRSEIPTEFNNWFFNFLHSWNPIFKSLFDKWFKRSNINTFFLRVSFKKIQDSKLTHNCLTTTSGCTNQDIFLSLIKREEDLCLDWIKEIEFRIKWLEDGIFKCRFRERLQT